MKLEEMVREFPQDFLSEEEIENCIPEDWEVFDWELIGDDDE